MFRKMSPKVEDCVGGLIMPLLHLNLFEDTIFIIKGMHFYSQCGPSGILINEKLRNFIFKFIFWSVLSDFNFCVFIFLKNIRPGPAVIFCEYARIDRKE